MRKLYFILLILLCAFVFLGWATIDPDFGWRIRVGQLILNQGIPQTDPFSFTMIKFPFVDHEWLTHVCIAWIYEVTKNSFWLSLLFGFFVATALYKASLVEKFKKKLDWFVPALIFLVGSSIFSVVGIRPQVWGWLLFVFWVNELRKGLKTNSLLLFIIQLIWVNTHGSFFLGIGIFILYVISKYIQKKKIKKHIKTLIVLLFITFINPYGWRIWGEVWMQLSDINLRWRIQEWMPGILFLNAAFWFYCVIFFSLLLKKWRETQLFERLLSLLFFLSALSSARIIPLFLFVSFPLCTQMWSNLEKNITKQMQKHFSLLKNTLIILCFFVGLVGAGNNIGNIKPINKIYPVDAVSFLVRHKAQGRIYSEYEWGGYLIWKAPALKVFIDGRMPSWRWKQNDPKQSSNSAEEFFFITSKYPSFEPYRKKYNITYALIRKGEKKTYF